MKGLFNTVSRKNQIKIKFPDGSNFVFIDRLKMC